jgi:hypothetical protein
MVTEAEKLPQPSKYRHTSGCILFDVLKFPVSKLEAGQFL